MDSYDACAPPAADIQADIPQAPPLEEEPVASPQPSAAPAKKAAPVDPLNQYRKALEQFERQQKRVAAALALRDEKLAQEAHHSPTISDYATKSRAKKRTPEEVAHAHEEWMKQRNMHLEKKRKEAEKEKEAETKIVKHLDPRSEQLCLQKGHRPVHLQWKDTVEEMSRRREKLEAEYRPSFTPARYSDVLRYSPTAAMEPGRCYLPERSRSATAQRLHHDFVLRRQRQTNREATAKADRDKTEEDEKRRSVSAGRDSRRKPQDFDKFVSHLLEWQEKIDMRRQLRAAASENDPEATFKPQISKRSEELAEHSRRASVPILPAHIVRKRSPGLKHRNRRMEGAKPVGLVKCAPLPADFWARNHRTQQMRNSRQAALRTEIDSVNKAECTFAPRLSMMSATIMSQIQRGDDDEEPHFMRPTVSIERHHTTGSEQSSSPIRAAKPAATRKSPPLDPRVQASSDADELDRKMAEMQATIAQWNALVETKTR
jgi:hypothetical protein